MPVPTGSARVTPFCQVNVDATTPFAEHFFRHEYGRLVAALCRRFGNHHLALVEEAVQTALVRALGTWRRNGSPKEPAAWLTRVAHNELVDQLRRQQTRDAHRTLQTLDHPEPAATAPPNAEVVKDDELRLLFVCCDPALPEKTRILLALRLLCGFSVEEIARRLFMSPAAIHKSLARGKSTLADRWRNKGTEAALSLGAADIPQRTESVQRVLYLLFNEGYSCSQGAGTLRTELCAEALRLAQLLVAHPGEQRTASWALLALFHFHGARLATRLDEAGGLLMLHEQDRSQWNRHQIQLGLHCLARSGDGGAFTRYHGEAAVLAEHCLAPSYEATRWGEIAELYQLLGRLEPSPLYELNRAIAIAEADGPEAGLKVLQAARPPSWLSGYYLWDATLGELHRRSGQFALGQEHLQRAVAAAPTEPERAVFMRRARLCKLGSRER